MVGVKPLGFGRWGEGITFLLEHLFDGASHQFSCGLNIEPSEIDIFGYGSALRNANFTGFLRGHTMRYGSQLLND